MTPADSWHDNGDGTAWWVTGDTLTRYYAELLDRPCDRCYGQDVRTLDVRGWHDHCPDCIDGRHTFDVEVANRPNRGIVARAYRVSIVPGIVLPIYGEGELADGDGLPCEGMTHIDTQAGRFMLCVWSDEGWAETPVELPPAAKPGMWAAKLKVHQ